MDFRSILGPLCVVIAVVLPAQVVAQESYDGYYDSYGQGYDPGYGQDYGTGYDSNYGGTQDPGYYDTGPGTEPVQGDMSMFYDALAPYGDWFYVPAYGYVWIPYVDHARWRPYRDNGYWVWSDYGWMWVSNYEWGWAPFHYGRWIWLDNAYWVWVPDTVWGPAWVAWRYTDAYVGWSPLPPGAYWYPNYGLDITVTIPWTWWYFVPGARLLDVHVARYGIPYASVRTVYYASRRATVYRIYGGVPVCVGVDVHHVGRWIGRPVPRVSVSIYSTRVVPTAVRAGRVTIYRPVYMPGATYRAVAPPPPRGRAPAALARVYAPPPPRTGVSASQVYRARAATVPAPAVRRAANQRADVVREQRDVRRETRQIRQGQREVRHDTYRIQQDRRDLRQDRRELGRDVRTGNTTEIQQDRRDLQRSRQQMNRDRVERAHDRRDVQRNRVERSRERRDVQRERVNRRY